jgi:type II secretory ATPase GspE/PulE/Tfp pilus assembly ATPase PilB-like protein
MRIDEHNMSQDGAIRYDVDGKPVNVRISIVPTLDGEKVALRLLAEYSRGLNVKNLGLSRTDRKIFDHQIHRPYGMIITTGPTGSGKTTTLYSLIKMINNPEINITTIEDPVEYKVLGVNQIQVNNQTKLDFTEGLRSMVRQDPDVILVGEIRDNDTAELAVNAALTGHLLFSTFHSNDAASAITRLLDMNVEPFLLASTLNLVIAQRLVRMIHPVCRYSFNVSLDKLRETLPNPENYFNARNITLYQGKGCEGCNFTGYHGRTAIFELINTTPMMKELILKNPSTDEVAALAKKQGDHTLFSDGIEKVQMGVTTLAELQRVAEPK